MQQAGGAGRKSFQVRGRGVDPLDDGSRVQSVREFFEDRLADGIGVHGLGENLQGEDVAVAVDDQSGEEIGFAENYAIGFGVVDQRLAIGNGIGDALAKQGWKIGDRIGRDHADRDLRGTRIESGAERLAAMIGDANQRAGRNVFGGDDVGAVDPDMAIFQAG